jgi:glycosyltransferase involved in cell wall biosynthesis
MDLSVLMSVYSKDDPAALCQCLESLVAQTLPANEVVIVQDGPLGDDLQNAIREYRSKLPIETVPLPHNVGLGGALGVGVGRCRFDVIARMDADDICALNRFEKQITYLRAHPEIDVVGSSIREFNSDPLHPLSERRLPNTHEAIAAYARGRNPVNHMTAVFRKAAVLAAGTTDPLTVLKTTTYGREC